MSDDFETEEQEAPPVELSPEMLQWLTEMQSSAAQAAETVQSSQKMQAIMEEASKLNTEIAKIKLDLKSKTARQTELLDTLLAVMKAIGLSDMRGHGFLFFKETKWSVKVPKDIESKRALFKHLQELGIYWQEVTVQSNSLNKLYNSLAEQAKEKGELEFQMPGVQPPKDYVKLKMKRSTKK